MTTPAAASRRFGQGAILTTANVVTIIRIAVAIPTLMVIDDRGASWLGIILWFAITATDSLDGWLARREGATRSGAFLDPVADKVIVIGGLAAIANHGSIPWWPVVVIAVREIGISLWRSLAGRRGIVVPAQKLGKYKAFSQYCAVGFVIFPWTETAYLWQDIVLYTAVVLTVVSGLQILRRGWVDWQRDT